MYPQLQPTSAVACRGGFRHVQHVRPNRGPHKNGAPTWGSKKNFCNVPTHRNCLKVIEVINKIKKLCGTGISVQRSPACTVDWQTHWQTPTHDICWLPTYTAVGLMKWQLCMWVRRQSGNEVILGTVGGSSWPIIVLGALGPPHFFLNRARFRVNPALVAWQLLQSSRPIILVTLYDL